MGLVSQKREPHLPSELINSEWVVRVCAVFSKIAFELAFSVSSLEMVECCLPIIS